MKKKRKIKTFMSKLKDFIFYNYTYALLHIYGVFVWNVYFGRSNQDLYIDKDDFWIFFKDKKFLIFNLKDFIFHTYICQKYK